MLSTSRSPTSTDAAWPELSHVGEVVLRLWPPLFALSGGRSADRVDPVLDLVHGWAVLIGWRYPVPNHEIYGGWDDGSGNVTWHPFGQYTNEGFICLTGSCGTRDVNVTNSY